MLGRIYTFFLLMTVYVSGSGQSPICSYCDSLIALPQLSDSDFDLLADTLFDLNYYISEEAHHLYLKAVQKALGQDNTSMAAHLQMMIAEESDELHRRDTSLYYTESAVNLYKSVGDELGYARTSNMRRLLATNENDFLRALNISYEGLEICKRYDDKVGMAIAYRDIGSVLIQEGKYQEGLDYCLRGVTFLEEAESWYELSFTYQRIAIANKNLGNYKLAESYIRKSMAVTKKLGYFRSNQGLANKYWTLGYIRDGQNDFNQALMAYDSAKYYADRIGYSLIDKWVFNSKGSVYLKLKEYSKALTYFEKVQVLSDADPHEVRTYNFYLPIYANLLESYRGLGDYEKALEIQDLIASAKDTVFAMESQKQILELQTKYETTQKEERIQSLQKQKNSQNRFLQLGAVAILLLSLLTLFLWRTIKYRNRTNALLRAQKIEIIKKSDHNEVLMKEIHHRVKNNLQILSSLLSLQSDAEENEMVLGALQEGRNRVEAMGMIHQRLYGDDILSAIEMKDYVPELCDYLQSMAGQKAEGINITSDVEVGLMDVETAIPLGLILNELITNSIKYAHAETGAKLIMVRLWIDEDKLLCLQVSDNGSNDSSEKSEVSSTMFGTKLVGILSKKLRGKIEIDKSNGYATTIRCYRFKLA